MIGVGREHRRAVNAGHQPRLRRGRLVVLRVVSACLAVGSPALAAVRALVLCFLPSLHQPGANTYSEPSLVIDSAGRIFVSASFGAPGRAGPAGSRPNGADRSRGDSALLLGRRDYLYGTDLRLGDGSIWYSSNHANSYSRSPVSHRVVSAQTWPADARPEDAIYRVHYRIAAEDPLGVGLDSPAYARDNYAPPGGIAVDQRTGEVDVSNWTIEHIPGTQGSGATGDDLGSFAPMVTDPKGDVYIAWAQITGSQPTSPNGIGVWVTMAPDGWAHWTKYRLPIRRTGVFPTLAVYGPGHVPVAWVDTSLTGNPNDSSFANASWSLQYPDLAGLGGRVHIAQATLDPVVHTGTLFVDPQGGDRGTGDFPSMAVSPRGQLVIAYTSGAASDNGNFPPVSVLPPRRAP